jgi:hypothetical protein
MLAGDLAFVFDDLCRVGLVSTVQVDRRSAAGRSARGVAIESRAPVDGGMYVQCYFTNSIETLVNAGFGGTEDFDILGVFPADTDLQERDWLKVVEGPRCGELFRVLDVHGIRNGLEPITATLQLAKS